MIPHADLKTFEKVRRALHPLPQLNLGKNGEGEVTLSSHILAEAVSRVYGLKAVQSAFLGYRKHGWVETPRGNVIDVLPIASCTGPVLYNGSEPLVTRRLFPILKPDKFNEAYSELMNSSWFWEAVTRAETWLIAHKEDDEGERVTLHSC